MKLLLDTHVFLWALLEPSRLGDKVAACLEDKSNQLWLSPITSWEVLVLAEKGRLVLQPNAEKWLRRVLARIPFHQALLNHEIAIKSRAVDLPHRDPADRFLVATAMIHDLVLVTADQVLLANRFCRTMAAA